MRRRLSAHISDANIVFSKATDGNRSSVHVQDLALQLRAAVPD